MRSSDHFNVYACGPTVYRRPHIGNFSYFIKTGVYINFLKASLNKRVKWAMCITDIGDMNSLGDDKIISEAKARSCTPEELVQSVTEVFIDDYLKLKIPLPDYMIPASSTINLQKELIETISKNGFARVVETGILLNSSKVVNRFGSSNLLSLQKSDFHLWRSGLEIPGWHTECLSIIYKIFGDCVDLHIGGKDHKDLHHNNEILQHLAYQNKNVKLAKSWLHFSHMVTGNEKMAKSGNNSIYIDDLDDIIGFKLAVLLTSPSKDYDFNSLDLKKIKSLRVAAMEIGTKCITISHNISVHGNNVWEFIKTCIKSVHVSLTNNNYSEALDAISSLDCVCELGLMDIVKFAYNNKYLINGLKKLNLFKLSDIIRKYLRI